jgi:hypothetical protein
MLYKPRWLLTLWVNVARLKQAASFYDELADNYQSSDLWGLRRLDPAAG